MPFNNQVYRLYVFCITHYWLNCGTYSILHDTLTDNVNMVCPTTFEVLQGGFVNRIVAYSFDTQNGMYRIEGFVKNINFSIGNIQNSSFNPSNGNGFLYASENTNNTFVLNVTESFYSNIENFDILVAMAYEIINGSYDLTVTDYLQNNYAYYEQTFYSSSYRWRIYNAKFPVVGNFVLNIHWSGLGRLDDICLFQVCSAGFGFDDSVKKCIATSTEPPKNFSTDFLTTKVTEVTTTKTKDPTYRLILNIATTLVTGKILKFLSKIEKEYLVSLDYYPNSYPDYGYYSIIRFTTTSGINYGYNGYHVPSIYLHSSGILQIASSINGNGIRYYETYPIALKEWISIEISQTLICGDYVYRIKLNGNYVYLQINFQSQNYNNVIVYASDLSWPSDGLIKNLYVYTGSTSTSTVLPSTVAMKSTTSAIEAPTKTGAPTTTKNFTSIPESSITSTFYQLVENKATLLVIGKILSVLPTIEKEYLVSFDYYPSSFPYVGFYSVIRFTSIDVPYDNEHNVSGVYLHSSGSLLIASSINGNGFKHYYTDVIELKQWINIEISQALKCGMYIYRIKLNSILVYLEVNYQSQRFQNIRVYASDLTLPSDGLIKNLNVYNGDASKYYPCYYKNCFSSSFCSVVSGYAVCSCPTGFKLQSDGTTCTQDPCDYKNCFSSSFCSEVSGYAVCSCPTGLKLQSDGTTCAQATSLQPLNTTTMKSLMTKATEVLTTNEDAMISTTYYLVENIATPLNSGKILAVLPTIEKEYLVSIDFYPNSFPFSLFYAVVRFTNIEGFNFASIQYHVPGIYLFSSGYLQIVNMLSDNEYSHFNTNPIALKKWINIEVSQKLILGYYVYRIKVNSDYVYSQINHQPQKFRNVTVYASDISWETDGLIKNLYVITGTAEPFTEPSKTVTTESTLLTTVEAPTSTNNAGTPTANKTISVINMTDDPIISTFSSLPSMEYSTKKTTVIIIATLGVVLFAFIVISVVAVTLLKRKVRSQPSMTDHILETIEHNNQVTSHEILADEWEIYPESFLINNKISEGAYSAVFMAKINLKVLLKTKHAHRSRASLPALNQNRTSNVAVKVLKDSASQQEIDDFREEINFMKKIAYHHNIVNMLGCSTVKKPLCLITEFMENGDLLEFLRDRRTKLRVQKDERIAYAPSVQPFERTTVRNSTTEAIYHEIPLEDIEIITPKDLLSFAYQVASGMEFLSKNKVVHRELSARKILVGAKKNIKVSIFGLSQRYQNELNYTSNKSCRLPIKWMSIEAFLDLVFTSYSDVWAYGVVLYEIVTLGGTPYPTISNNELLEFLKSGKRMDRPDNCSTTLYNIMLQCWNENPLLRPSFAELRDHLEELLSQGGFYFSFDINEENLYYSSASFNHTPSETGNGSLEVEVIHNPHSIV
ncbi:uncharacterized protein LOC100198829 isoform X2 [Hydra vulgaris]|uniref:uncharacterized protein LOC100198829 isoform X2 n=1 Tax=Hydra vulgaris TaxID=6087 RepID=UPI0032EA3F23